MSKKGTIRLPIELLIRIDEFIKNKGRSMGIENRTALAKRVIDEFLSKYENK